MPETHLRLLGHTASLCGDRDGTSTYVVAAATCPACLDTPVADVVDTG